VTAAYRHFWIPELRSNLIWSPFAELRGNTVGLA
jgi:hypothetical protein